MQAVIHHHTGTPCIQTLCQILYYRAMASAMPDSGACLPQVLHTMIITMANHYSIMVTVQDDHSYLQSLPAACEAHQGIRNVFEARLQTVIATSAWLWRPFRTRARKSTSHSGLKNACRYL